MASISANGSKGHHKFTLTVTETSTSVSNNTSTISFRFQIDPIKIPSSAANAWDWEKYTNPSNTISYKVVINGTTYSGTIPEYDAMGTLTLKSGTQIVAHNTDGTKPLSFSFVVTDATTVNFTSGDARATGTLALTPLERPSTGAAPIISPYVEDINDKTVELTGNSSTLVRYHSSAYATMDVTPQGGATIAEDYLIIRNGGETGWGDSHTFRDVESNVFTFQAEDDRGNVGTETYTAGMVNYIRLTCNMANSKPDADGDMYLSCSGNYFNGNFGAQYNSLTVQYSYSGVGVDTTKYNASGSGTMTVSTSGNTYTAYANLSGLDYQATYTFTIEAEDELETATSVKSGVKSKPIFHWGENDFVFEVPVKFNGADTVTFKGDLWLKGDESYGNTLYFGDRRYDGAGYCYIAEPAEDVINIHALNGLQINEKPVCGEWMPRLNDSAVSYYSEQNGWYQRLGNVVTIGWYIHAHINSEYNSTKIEISGIPADPATNAFGGGLAYNVYVTTGHAFECWCVDTDGTITGRTQPCNNTSAGNLSVGSTVNYPSGGGEIKLSGTICYMVKQF